MSVFDDIRNQLQIVEGSFDEAIIVIQGVHSTIESITTILDDAGVPRKCGGKNLLLDERVSLLAQREAHYVE